MRKFEKSSSDRVIVGVCGGLARSMGWNADLLRVAWIVLATVGGMGIALYLAGFLLAPREEEVEVEPPPELDRARTGGFALVALAALFLAWLLGLVSPWSVLFGGVFLPLIGGVLLVGVGLALIFPGVRNRTGLAGRSPLLRSRSDRMLGGIAGGLAAHMGADSNVLRLAMVLAGLLSAGFVAVVYVALLLVLPEESEDLHTVESFASPPDIPREPPPAPPTHPWSGDIQDPPADDR
ncbi:MAG: PspC domain-containing protein [Gemmatimonadota bacterium]|jgi:phage shock protein PspC (stress-responsive transcriptional regulator)|nr:PspC domain-containing protein [Gemmatimonadota bacterium]MDP6528101.1 PspC domain-containing protein [Gemmatimonadota bacterium]MDP6802295.1 PspC domain-containing protein [Gemmatimonadota bacterium]MDP7031971.1 PspC domain-containing protein [Gemmatimonadota bacterium]